MKSGGSRYDMKKYYPCVLDKMLWAYKQVIDHFVPMINYSRFIDDINRFSSLAIQIYPDEVKYKDPDTLSQIYITKRLAKIINDYFMECLKLSPVDNRSFRACKRLVNGYIHQQFARYKTERIQ